jgi:hypothetical protein
MCIARAGFAIVVECVAGEGAIVIARPAQEKQFLLFFSMGVAANPHARRAAQRRAIKPLAEVSTYSKISSSACATARNLPCWNSTNSLLKNDSSPRRKPGSRKRASCESMPYWMPAFAGMTNSRPPQRFSTNC